MSRAGRKAGAGMRHSPLPWHAQAVERRVSLGLPHALMVVGRRGDGLEEACLHLAESELTRGDPAGSRLMHAGTHPDLHAVRLELNTKGKPRQNIVIGQVRELAEATSLTPVKAHMRIAVIVPACHMNRSAANALLKNLEEPNRTLKFILGCEHPSWLPATVRSRCQRTVLPRPTRDEAAAWLADRKVKDAGEVLDLVDGAPLLAEEKSDLLPARREVAGILRGKSRLSGMNRKVDSLEPEDWLPWAVDWSARGARIASGVPDGGEGDGVAADICARRRPSALEWLDLHGEMLDLMRFAHHPVNKRLLLDHVLWRFSGLGSGAR